MFATRTGARPSGGNLRSRVLNVAVAAANEDMAKREENAATPAGVAAG